ncbi:phage tail protein [Mesoterricola silvestris]|uniref:Uncharacterized protein n=1 Tax=Mesoterricola silvestris TaxID=2927979 RepID=A0AA48H0S4_9BACT|nr:hypothetical protein [Mesoterricola silvestris]BDU73933.1 hypothetical protein METEAL_31070 [Mesoterricola silvestris]
MPRPSVWLIVLVGLLALLGASGCSSGKGGGTSGLNGPTNLTVTGDLSVSPYLNYTWTAPTNRIDGYEFEVALGDGSFTKLGQDLVPASWTAAYATFDPAALPENSELRARMRAVLGTTYSPYSNEVRSPLGLKAPTFTSATSVVGGISLKWTNNSSVADAMTLERGTSATYGSTYAWDVIPGVSFGATDYLDSQAPEGGYVCYRITYSKGTKTVQATSDPLSTGLKSPGSVVATPLVEGVSLTWQNHSAGATEVVVTRASGLSTYPSYQDVAHLAPTASSYQDLLLASGYYTYRIEARKTGSAAAPSLPVMVVTLPTAGSLSLAAPVIKSLPPSVMGALDGNGAWTFAQYVNYSSYVIATPSPTGWVTNPLTNAASLVEPKLRLDSQGRPHTVYLRQVMQGSSEMAIVHAWSDGAVWQTEEVARRTLGYSSSTNTITFTLDGADALHVAWSKDSYSATGFEYAYKDATGTWKVESLDVVSPAPGVVYSFRLTTDASGVPSVLLGAWQELYLLQRQGPNAWKWEKIPTGVAISSWYDTLDLLFSYRGDLHVFYTRPHTPYDSSIGSELCEIRKVDGAWTPVQVIGTTGANGSTQNAYFARSAKTDRIVIHFRGPSGQQLVTFSNDVWSSQTLGPYESNRPYLGFDGNDKFYLLQMIGYTSSSSPATYVLYSEAP